MTKCPLCTITGLKVPPCMQAVTAYVFALYTTDLDQSDLLCDEHLKQTDLLYEAFHDLMIELGEAAAAARPIEFPKSGLPS